MSAIHPYVSIRYFTNCGSPKSLVPASCWFMAPICAISSSVRVKSKMSMFCSMRSLWVDLGIATMPRWVSHRVAHSLFVLIGLGCVYEPIAHAQCIAYATLTLIGSNEKHSVAQGRHLNAV